MKILYLFRSPGTGHSIEQLFEGVRYETSQCGLQTMSVYLPHRSRGLRTVWQNLRFVRRLTADVFHITGDVQYAALALPAARTILTIHDCFLLANNRHRPLRYLVFWLIWYYLPIRRARVVTAVSEKTRQELLHYLGDIALDVQVVTNGYDPQFTYSPAVFDRHHPTLLQLGTAVHKNVLNLLKAIEGIPCRLVLVGPLSDEIIAELTRLNINYRQYVDLSQAAVRQLYVSCDIVTFLSTYEGFGLPIIEANAVGRVVLTADMSPMREIAGGAAHLADPGNLTAIRQGILALIRNGRYRQDLIDKGVTNAQRYTMALAAKGYIRLYGTITQPSTCSHV